MYGERLWGLQTAKEVNERACRRVNPGHCHGLQAKTSRSSPLVTSRILPAVTSEILSLLKYNNVSPRGGRRQTERGEVWHRVPNP